MAIDNLQFSSREQETINLLLQGKSNKQIALSLNVSISTVEFHLKNIYRKLQVKSRTEAILRLGKSVGDDKSRTQGQSIGSEVDKQRESIVDKISVDAENGVHTNSHRRIPMKQSFYLVGGSLLFVIVLAAIAIFVKVYGHTLSALPTTQAPLSTVTMQPTIVSTTVPATPESTMATCPVETADFKLFTNANDGYCFLYPIENTAFPPSMVVINPNGISGGDFLPGDFYVLIQVEDALGRTTAQVANEKIAEAGAGFNITLTSISVDGKEAAVIDGLPSQDSTRHVFIIANDRLYTFFFTPWDPRIEGFSQSLLKLYSTVTNNFHFLPTAP